METITDKRFTFYDLTIKNLSERISHTLIFDSIELAAEFVGYIPSRFIIRVGKGKTVTRKLNGKKYTVRYLN